jgi:copper chaperone CopZ
MHKRFSLMIAAFCLSTLAFAQPTKKIVIQTPSVQCEKCKTRIENYLKREPGVQVVHVDFKRKTTTVTYITDRNDSEQLKASIANIGYDADEITAEETAYKRLPACCKKPEKVADAPAAKQ